MNTEPRIGLLFRLSIPGVPEDRSGVVPDPVYGDQLATAAVSGVRPEGQVSLKEKLIHGRFVDGKPFVLRQPLYSVNQLGYGPLHPHVMISPRVAPQLIGVGLIEAISDNAIQGNERLQANALGPIKGQANRVWDVYAQREMIGRFGWKANSATLAHQTAAAFLGDIGITSSWFPKESCTAAQKDCRESPSGRNRVGSTGSAHVEIDDKTLEDVVFYQAALAVPARRSPDARGIQEVRRGERLFHQAQCAACHRPSYVTTPAPFPRLSSPAIAGQVIWPYTDLLLHDMGPGLADGRPDHQANGRQWKTPPLWGIGLLRDVNGHQRLLHDGRANGVLEAILWHGGEAQASRDAVIQFSASERAALVRFVESL